MFKVMKEQGMSISEIARTRKQKGILDALEKVSWW